METRRHSYSSLATPILSSFVFGVGLFTILSLTTSRLPHELTAILPFALLRLTRSVLLVAGLLLILFSQQLRRRKRTAFYATVVVLGVITWLSATIFRSSLREVVYAFALLALIANHKVYTARFNDVDLKRGLATAVLLLGVGLLYGTIGFYLLRSHYLGYDADTWRDSLAAAANQIFTFSGSAVPLGSRNARWFFDSLRLVSLTTIVLAATALFRPVQFLFNATQEEIHRARKILKKWSTCTEDYFKLWPLDKHYFFSDAGSAFLAYKVSHGVALILDNLAGDPTEFPTLFRTFLEFAGENGWQTAVVHADPATVALAQSFGLTATYIGSEATINISSFLEKTIHSKHFRYVANRAARDELQTELWRHPLTAPQCRALRQISDAWIASGRSEFTYIMAPFSDEYLTGCDVAVVLRQGQSLAYANLLPTFQPTQRTIDHMRAYPDAPSVTMHFLFLSLLTLLHRERVTVFNLGLAPLSGIEELRDSTLTEKVLALAKRLGSRLYSFEGVELFKKKYDPDWEPRYLVYQEGLLGLLQLSRALNTAITVKGTGNRRLSLPVLLGIGAGVSYLSFIVAPWLVPTVPAVVSQLGAHGQPYAAFFNGADICSGLLTWCFCYLLIQKRTNSSSWWTLSVTALMIGAFGSIAAALVELPALSMHHNLLANDLHILLSALNIGGVLVSVWFFTLFWIRSARAPWLLRSFTALLTLASCTLVFTFSSPALVGLVERAVIVLCALWLIFFPLLS